MCIIGFTYIRCKKIYIKYNYNYIFICLQIHNILNYQMLSIKLLDKWMKTVVNKLNGYITNFLYSLIFKRQLKINKKTYVYLVNIEADIILKY